MSAVEYENMNFVRFGRFQHTYTWQGDVHLCVSARARLRGRDYMQADEGGVSDMFIGLHNIITLQAYVDRIAVPDKNYATWSCSLLLSLPEYKLTRTEGINFGPSFILLAHFLLTQRVRTLEVASRRQLEFALGICHNVLCKLPFSVAKTRQY
jgi:hypothetical protein